MRSRLFAILGVSLLFVMSACSSKPTDSAANTAANDAADQTATTSTPSGTGGGSMANNSRAMAPAPAPKIQSVVVPAGTTLTVRLGQALGSKLSTPGQTFTATLAAPVAVDGATVIPSGAQVQGVVIDAKSLGKFKGAALLQIKLNSIVVNGSERSIQTSSITRSETGKGKRTAVVAGGGAALGAIIGGIAGGGKGAAIGALAGGGAGTAGAAYTGNKEIVLPAESAVSFKLETALEIK